MFLEKLLRSKKYRDKLYKRIFILGDKFKIISQMFSDLALYIFALASAVSLIVLGFHIGFYHAEPILNFIIQTYKLLLVSLFISKVLIYFSGHRKISNRSVFINLIIIGYFLALLFSIIHGVEYLAIGCALIILSETGSFSKYINSLNIPPSLLFVSSFLIIIFIGSILLFLPKAHTNPISYLDSLFTSTSAVCVTGLIVVDTAKEFTLFGKVIIMCLIQIGGLGIMAFTGFFSYLFTGNASFRERVMLKDIFSVDTLGGMFRLLTKIIVITFAIEVIGALILFISVDGTLRTKLFFAVFHSVSAFCNAGFSTLSEGLFTQQIRQNSSVQLTIGWLIVLGGIGFPVLMRFHEYLIYLWHRIARFFSKKRNLTHLKPGYLSSRIAIITTIWLILAGMGFYLLFENGTSLSNMGWPGKLTASFFGSVSARTAGFNMVDISQWSNPTVYIMMLLMWIGASPGSTGGGIKTTTFAIAIRSMINTVKGKERLEIVNREVAHGTLARVLAVITISILVIATGFVGIMITDPGKSPTHLMFECVSAFATVGLSLANTSTLSEGGKTILILLMFVGRVGPITLFSVWFKSARSALYSYPKVEIQIN